MPSAEAAHRAEALLVATSRFVRCDDVDSLAAAVLDALASIFGSTKSAIILTDEDGSLRLEATRGYSAADLELTSAAIRDVTPFVLPVAAGDEVWSDDDRDDALHDQLAAYGSIASFSLPIVTGTGVAGNITGMFET